MYETYDGEGKFYLVVRIKGDFFYTCEHIEFSYGSLNKLKLVNLEY